ncbi:MAG: transposase zinc-binding domain-containing protein [Saprospiraceae bacterium]|nr:transposase zinc-binding domain-containing protein [Saprospiraceae bacterium]
MAKKKTYLYKSCGNNQCPKCQSIKRIQWQDKLASKMLKCPYQHIIFTIPHELNYIGKGHPKLLYGVLFKAAWLTIERLARDPENVGRYTRNDSRTAYIWLRSQTTYTPAYPGHLWRCKQGWQMGMAQTKK